MFSYFDTIQNNKFEIVIGIDEAGRGPLAGPVVASAVLLKNKSFESVVRDSKKISEKQRDLAFCEICEKSYLGIGIINETVIDQVNILEATFLAMNRAVAQLINALPEEVKGQKKFSEKVCLLVDGNRFKTYLPYAYRTIVAGDASILSISCASIIAKVTRDRILAIYDKIFPEYGFQKHKGYPTKKHKEAIQKYGLSLIHRKSFKFI